jgi:hypothetical protein
LVGLKNYQKLPVVVHLKVCEIKRPQTEKQSTNNVMVKNEWATKRIT